MERKKRMPANAIDLLNKFDLRCRLSHGGVDWMKEVGEEIKCSETNWGVVQGGTALFITGTIGLWGYCKVRLKCYSFFYIPRTRFELVLYNIM
jgi:hypothetical protein